MLKRLLLLIAAYWVTLGGWSQNHWVPNPHQFPTNMNTIATLEINGVEQRTDIYELGVFYGEECRGSQRLRYFPEPWDRYLFFLTTYGQYGDEFSFRLYDHSKEQELDLLSHNTLMFIPNDIIGTMAEPYVFSFEGDLSLEEPDDLVELYPNPARDKVWVNTLSPESGTVPVSVYDGCGRLVLRGEAPMLDVSGLAAGVYVVKIGADAVRKLVLCR